MPVIPVYEKRLTPEMSGGAARVPTDDPVGAAIAQGGGGLQRVGAQLEEQRQKQEEFEEKVRAQNILLRGSQMFAEQQQQRQQEWNFGDDMRPQFDRDFAKWQRENLSTFKTSRIREFFNGQANQFRAAMGGQINEYQTGQIRQRDYNTLVDDLDRKQSTVYQDPDAIDAAREDYLQSLELNQTLDPATKQALGLSMRNSLAYAYNVKKIEGGPGIDPEAYMREYGPAMARATGMPWQGVDSKAAFDAAILTESGGKQFDASGNPITSPKGATGIAQVMKDTGPYAAALAGLAWDENRWKNDPDYNYAIGRAYFDKQMQDFGGDVEKAWAAYNAGPGALRIAIAKAESQGGTYLDHLPEETQKYVAINRQRLGNVGIQSQQSMQLPPHWDDMTFPQQRELFNKMMAASKARDTQWNTNFDLIHEASVTSHRGGQESGLDSFLPRENYHRRYPDNPLLADLKWQEHERTKGIPQAVANLQQARLPELQRLLDTLESGKPPGGLSYQADEKNIAALKAAAEHQVKILTDDPALAVSQNNPVMDGLGIALGNAEKAYNNAVNSGDPAAIAQAQANLSSARNGLYMTRNALQTEKGVAVVQPMTQAEVQEFARQYNGRNKTQQGELIVNFIDGLSQDNARSILMQLEDAEIVPQYAWLVANIADPNQRAEVLNVLLAKEEDLKNVHGIDNRISGQIRAKALEVLQGYRGALDLTDTNNIQDLNALVNVVSGLAYRQYARTNDVGKSVTLGLETLLPGWQFVDGRSVWRGISGAAQAIAPWEEGIAGTNYGPRVNIAIPPGTKLSGSDAMDGLSLYWAEEGRHLQFAPLLDSSGIRTPEELRQETNLRLSDQVYWVSMPDMSGAMLVVESVGGVRAPVLTIDGERVTRNWEQIYNDKLRQEEILRQYGSQRMVEGLSEYEETERMRYELIMNQPSFIE